MLQSISSKRTKKKKEYFRVASTYVLRSVTGHGAGAGARVGCEKDLGVAVDWQVDGHSGFEGFEYFFNSLGFCFR